MIIKRLFPILYVFLTLLSCTTSPEETQLDPDTQILVDILLDEMNPLASDPLSWEDEELRWLNPLAAMSVVGLGEATHGSAEFFDAKHRIFRYLAENHGFRVFAFEADFGESIFINEAVQQGNAAEIESLMNSKMHFWTWKTQEVKELLEWMCTFNQGKTEENKIHYVGVDCQFNTYHPDMARDYLELAGTPFLSFADSVLSEAEEADSQNYASFDEQSFGLFLERLDALKDSLTSYSDFLIAATSRKEYLEDARIAVWAHNFHVSDFESGSIRTMGNYLRYALWDQYAAIGFLFSRGEFTAVGMEGDQYTELGTQSLDSIPKAGSLNALMSHTGQAVFSVEMDALANHLAWYNAFEAGMDYFFIGSAYNNRPGDYYISFDPDLYHNMIYFDNTRASVLLK